MNDPLPTESLEAGQQPPDPGPAVVDLTADVVARLAGRNGVFDRYRVGARLGQGGMGSVLRVWDADLRRDLAMKVMLAGSAGEAVPQNLLARFLEEAQVTGQLDHPGIPPIHELGLDPEGHVYFTMKLVRGETLRQVFEHVRAGEGGWSLHRALGLLVKVCDAMAYAHHKHVVHRDLKPDNVMVGRFGAVYVMDWGLARVLGRDLPDDAPQDAGVSTISLVDTDRHEAGRADPDSPFVTVDGTIVGTPAYMSPEQGRGRQSEIDTRSDVYSVGAILYHLLSGNAPYVPEGTRPSPLAVLHALLRAPPAPLHAVAPSVPAELAAICEKAMQRDPADRYASMELLGEDLRAFVEGRVVHAYETGAVAEFRKWVRRNRGMAASLAAAILLALVGLIATTLVQASSNERLSQQKQRADRHAFVANIGAAALSLDAGNTDDAARRLERCPPELRGWEWHHLRLRQDTSLVAIALGSPIATLAFDPTGEHVAASSQGGLTGVWNASTGRRTALLEGHEGRVQSLAWRPDGGALVTGAWDRSVRLWDARTGAALAVLAEGEESVHAVAFAPAPAAGAIASGPARLVASASTTGTLRLYDADAGAEIARLDGHTKQVRAIAFSHRGELLASGSYDSTVRVWRVPSGEAVHELTGHESSVAAVAFAPDDSALATASHDGTVRVWSASDGRLLHVLADHERPVLSIAFAPDGARLASASHDATVRVWDLATGSAERVLVHPDKVQFVAWSPGGRQLASAGGDKTVRLWDVATGKPAAVLRGHEEWIEQLAFSPDGRRLASGSGDGTVRIWARGTEDGIASLAGHGEWIECVAYAPDGERIASGSRDGELRVWDAATGAGRAIEAHRGAVHSIAFDPTGARLATGSADRTLAVWSTGSLERVGAPRRHDEAVLAVAFAPTDRRVATGSSDDKVRVWDADGACRATLIGHARDVTCVAFDPSGTRIASGSDDGSVRVWNAAGGDELAVLEGHEYRVTAVAFHPDGRHVVSASWDRTVRVWDLESETPPAVLRGSDRQLQDLAVHPDGTRIAAASWDRTVRLWDVGTGEIVARLAHPDPVTAVAWSPDGSRLVTGTREGANELRVWESDLERAHRIWSRGD